MLGYSEEEIVARGLSGITHVDDLGLDCELTRQLGRGDIPRYTMEKRYVRKDGKVIWGRLNASVTRDAKGMPATVIGMVEDITEQKTAEMALLEARDELEQRVEERTAELTAANAGLQREMSERRLADATLEAFFRNSTAILNILDEELRYIKTDAITPTYFSCNGQDITGMSLRELAPHAVDCFFPMIRRVLETGEPIRNAEVSSAVPGRSEAVAHWLASYFPLALPEQKRGVGIVAIEITKRKQAEDALRQSHDELQAMYDHAVDGMLLADVDTLRLVRANASICKMLGYTESELLSLSVTDIHPAESQQAIAGMFRVAPKTGPFPTGSHPILRKDGSVFHAEITGAVIMYNGRHCAMGFFRDITERKQSHDALERERRTLRHMLQASDHERQVISYDIHDGLAQQLAAAIMQFQVHDALKKSDPAQGKTAYDAGVQMVQQAHGESRRLISGVRPPALDEAGVAVAISHLVHEQRGATGPTIEYHDDVQFDRLPPILENAIYRIAQEAVSNACRHSGSEKVRVSLFQEGDRLRLEVQDWGVGFDPETVDEDRYGLEGIRERIRLLGGELDIQSAPGAGTRIRAILPIVA
jgi:PAS domain S-box-containing protein